MGIIEMHVNQPEGAITGTLERAKKAGLPLPSLGTRGGRGSILW